MREVSHRDAVRTKVVLALVSGGHVRLYLLDQAQSGKAADIPLGKW